MSFLSIIFIIFMMLLFIVLLLIKQEEIRQDILLIASYLFYAYADYRFIVPLLLQTVIAYSFSRIISNKRRKSVLIFGLALSIGMLAILKYASVFVKFFYDKEGGGDAKRHTAFGYIILYLSGCELYNRCLSE